MRRALRLVASLAISVAILNVFSAQKSSALDPLSVPTFTVSRGANPNLAKLDFTPDARARYQVRIYYSGDNYTVPYLISNDYTPGTDASNIANPSSTAACASAMNNPVQVEFPQYTMQYCLLVSRGYNFRFSLVVTERSTSTQLPESPKSNPVGFLHGIATGGALAGWSDRSDGIPGIKIQTASPVGTSKIMLGFRRSDDYAVISSYSQSLSPNSGSGGYLVALTGGYSYKYDIKLSGGISGTTTWFDSDFRPLTMTPMYVSKLPEPVTNIVVTPTPDGKLHVSWNYPTQGNLPATSMVYVSSDKATLTRAVESFVTYPTDSVTLSATAVGNINTPFVPGTQYYIVVSSTMSSPDQQPVRVWTSQPVTVQMAPGAPLATFTAADKSINATWDEPQFTGGITPKSYEIQVSSNGTTWSSTTFEGSARSGSVSGLTNGTQYSVRIRAVNDTGGGNWETSTATPIGIPTPVTQAVTSIGSTTARVAMGVDAQGDNVHASLQLQLGSVDLTGIDFGSTNSSTFTSGSDLTGLIAGRLYRVRAKVQASNSILYYGLWKTFTTTPNAVTGVVATSTSTTVTVAWDSVYAAPATYKYNVWAELDGERAGVGCTDVMRGSSDRSSCVITELQPGILYDIRISNTVTGADYGNGTSSVTKNAVATKRLQIISDNSALIRKLYVGLADFSISSYFGTDSGLPVSFASTTGTKCMIVSLRYLSIRAAGTCTLTISQSGNSTFGPAETRTVSLTIAAAQTISFSLSYLRSHPPKVASTAIDLSTYGTASSGLAVTFVSKNSSICAINDTSLTLVSTGICEVIALQTGSDLFTSAPQVVDDFTVVKGDQATLSITSTGGEFDAPLAIQTSGGSGTGIVTYTISSSGNTSNCSKTASGVKAMQPGDCVVQAIKAGDSDFLETSSNYRTLVFTKATQDITFVAIPDTIEGSVLNPSVSSTSGLSVSLQSLTTSVCTLSNGSISLDHAGTCRIKASQAGDTKYLAATDVTIQFESNSKATPQTGTMRYDRTRTYRIGDTIDFYVAEDVNGAQSDVPGTFTFLADTPGILEFDSQIPGRATIIGRPSFGMLQVMYRFTPSGGYAALYNPALGPAALQVAQSPQPLVLAPQVVPYDEPAQFSVSGILGTGQLSYGLSPLDRNMQNTSARNALCTVTGTVVTRSEPGTCVVRAMIGSDNQYEATDSTEEFVFAKKTQVLSIENNWMLDEANYATRSTTYDLSTMAVSSEGLSVDISTTSSACSISSGVLTVVSAGQCTIKLSQSGSSTIEAVSEYLYAFTIGKATQSPVSLSTTSTTFRVPLTLTASGGDGNGSIAFDAADGAATGCRIVNGALVSDTAGTCLVQTTKSQSVNFDTYVSSPEIVTIEKASHTIAFSFSSLPTVRVGDSPFSIASFATLSSGQPASFVSGSPSICTVSGTVVTVRAAGQCIIDADFSENISYTAISTVTRYFTVEGTATVGNEAVTAPRNVSLVRGGSKSLVATWLAPASGQSSITTYVATLSPGGKRCSISVTTCTFTGLDATKSYSVSVVAVSATVTSASAISSSVIPNIQMGVKGKTNLRTMITTLSKGTKKWSVKGGCKIVGQMFLASTKPGTCTLTLTTAKYKATPKATSKVTVQVLKK